MGFKKQTNSLYIFVWEMLTYRNSKSGVLGQDKTHKRLCADFKWSSNDRMMWYKLRCRCRRPEFLCVHTLSRRGSEWGQASSHVRAAEGRVGGRAQGPRDDQQRAGQDGAHGGRGQAAGGRRRHLRHQPAGGLQRGRNTHTHTHTEILQNIRSCALSFETLHIVSFFFLSSFFVRFIVVTLVKVHYRQCHRLVWQLWCRIFLWCRWFHFCCQLFYWLPNYTDDN